MQKFFRFTILFISYGLFVVYTSAATTPYSLVFSRNLAIPDHGEDVSRLQQFLIDNGYLNVEAPTSYFGERTYNAVVEWQTDIGLPGTGYFGPESRKQIQVPLTIVPVKTVPISTAVAKVSTSTSQINSAAILGYKYTRNLEFGDSGKDVSAMQAFLISKGLLKVEKPTGYFGDRTLVALQTWQVTHNVPATGYFGPKTRAAMIQEISAASKSSAKVATISTSPNKTTTVNTVTEIYTDSTDDSGTLQMASVIGGADTTAPSVPGQPRATSTTPTSVSLSWTSSRDNVAMAGYKVYRNGVALSNTTIPAFTDYGASPGTTYTYAVAAYDFSNNISPKSTSTSITTLRSTTSTTNPTPTPTTTTLNAPTGLKILSTTQSTVGISWTPSPNTSVTGYKVYRNNIQVSTSTQTTFTDTGLASGSYNIYAVAAFTGSNLVSPKSTTVSTTTLKTTTTTSTPPPPTPTTTTPTTSTLNYNYGMAVGSSFIRQDDAQLAKSLDNLVSLGVGWVRLDMEWANVQWKDSVTYDWAQLDRVVNAIVSRKLKILAILDYTPLWARDPACTSGSHCPPTDPSKFAIFAKAAVTRYASKGVTAWEVWNEPNNKDFWGGKANCEAYTTLLKLVYPAIKQASPSATVITAGLSPAATDGTNYAPVDFVSCIYKNGGKNYFDAVADHPYTFVSFPSTPVPHAWNQMISTSPSIRSVMVANGDEAKKVWITEFGAPTNGPDASWYVSETIQTDMLADAVNLYKSYNWVGPLFWYTLNDSGTTTNTSENFFGLVRYGGSFKPAFTKLKELLAK